MKLTLYGGMANNLYVLAHEVQNVFGIECRQVRDRNDHFAFSQPCWEDGFGTMSYSDVITSASWDWSQWKEWEKGHNWRKPKWLLDPDYEDQDLSLEACFNQSDLLLVCGVIPTIAAYRSGRPYVIMPHGGDIRLAAGLTRTQPANWKHKLFGHPQDRVLRSAYKHARAVVTHGPVRIGGPLTKRGESISKLLPGVRFETLSLPVRPRPRLDADTRRVKLNQLLRHLKIPEIDAPFVIFVPSRIDYYWKGQDRLLSALEALSKNNNFHVIFSGWGVDYLDLQSRANKSITTFLPFSLSKQLLYKFYTSVDIVCDQFILGHYGTSAQEAMACGAPVMMWNDDLEYLDNGRTPPPVINVHDVNEIQGALQQIQNENIDFESVGIAGKKWIEEAHSAGKVVQHLTAIKSQR